MKIDLFLAQPYYSVLKHKGTLLGSKFASPLETVDTENWYLKFSTELKIINNLYITHMGFAAQLCVGVKRSMEAGGKRFQAGLHCCGVCVMYFLVFASLREVIEETEASIRIERAKKADEIKGKMAKQGPDKNTGRSTETRLIHKWWIKEKDWWISLFLSALGDLTFQSKAFITPPTTKTLQSHLQSSRVSTGAQRTSAPRRPAARSRLINLPLPLLLLHRTCEAQDQVFCNRPERLGAGDEGLWQLRDAADGAI